MKKIVDTHYHATSRSANDYEALALSGIKHIIEPCHRARQHFNSENDYIQLITKRIHDECLRSSAFGIKIHFGLGIMAVDMPDDSSYYNTLDEIINMADNKNVCCYGEVEYDPKVPNGKEKFVNQLSVFNTGKLPIIISIPHINREDVLLKTMDILQELKESDSLNFEKIILDGLLINEVKNMSHFNFGAIGVPVSPRIDSPFIVFRKSYPDEIVNVLTNNNIDSKKIIFNSSIGYGYGDPWGLAKVADHLYRKDIPNSTISKLFYENAMMFFKLG